jgi:hypothetical protein
MISVLAVVNKGLSWTALGASISGFIIALVSPWVSTLLGVIGLVVGILVFLLFISLGTLLEQIGDLRRVYSDSGGSLDEQDQP